MNIDLNEVAEEALIRYPVYMVKGPDVGGGLYDANHESRKAFYACAEYIKEIITAKSMPTDEILKYNEWFDDQINLPIEQFTEWAKGNMKHGCEFASTRYAEYVHSKLQDKEMVGLLDWLYKGGAVFYTYDEDWKEGQPKTGWYYQTLDCDPMTSQQLLTLYREKIKPKENQINLFKVLDLSDKYCPDKCEKPNCRCVEIAEAKNGGNPVKNYPCLAKCEDLEALKSK